MVMAMAAVMAGPALASHAGDRDCSDFKTQAAAQAFFNDHGGSASNNVDNLDRDRDGMPCEGLPGGSGNSNGNSGNGNGNLPDSATDPVTGSVSTGTPLPLLVIVLGLGTFGLMLRRLTGVRR